jgi:hypothetical protein
VLFIVAIVLGLAGPVLDLSGVVVAVPPLGVQVLGLVLALAGFVATLTGQTGMTNEWRIGRSFQVSEGWGPDADAPILCGRNPGEEWP